ncbi:hypothetical protein FGL97_14480 [Pseudomonas putida]|nr:hypothetical protein [Pseudomonas putida]NVN69584.1 hypothetical protein [Pseudomonas putida]
MITRACRTIAHPATTVTGWAFPLSFCLLPLNPFFSIKWVVVAGSSFWMLGQADPRNFNVITEHLKP